MRFHLIALFELDVFFVSVSLSLVLSRRVAVGRCLVLLLYVCTIRRFVCIGIYRVFLAVLCVVL